MTSFFNSRRSRHPRQARDHHRRQQRHRPGGGACAGGGRRRGDARRPQPRQGPRGRGRDRRQDGGARAGPREPRVGARVRCRAGTGDRPADQQRRRDDPAAFAGQRTASSCSSGPTTWATSRSPTCCCRSITGRVVTLSSSAHRIGRIDFDDLNWERKRYRAWGAYGQSKLANLLFTERTAAPAERGRLAVALDGRTSRLRRHQPSVALRQRLLGAC